MQRTIYVGPFTDCNLKSVEQGVTTLAHLRTWKQLHNRACKANSAHRNADYELSLDEVLSVLEPLEDRTPKALIATLYECQAKLSDIEKNPERFATKHLTPDVAREWYSSQIGTIRRLLQK